MDLDVLLRNIETMLAERNESADAVSKRAGKPDAIRNLRRYVEGKSPRSWTLDTLQAVADALETQPWVLLKPRGAMLLDGEARAAIKALIREEIAEPAPARGPGHRKTG